MLQNWAYFAREWAVRHFLEMRIWLVLDEPSIHVKRGKEVERGESQMLASTESLASWQTPASVRDPVWKLRWDLDHGLKTLLVPEPAFLVKSLLLFLCLSFNLLPSTDPRAWLQTYNPQTLFT